MYRPVHAVFLFAGVLVAQGGGGGGQATALTEFATRLKLEEKTQIPAVETIFTDAARAAIPVAQAVGKARHRFWMRSCRARPMTSRRPTAAYAAAAAK
jgi:hypothetical protein